MSSSITTVSGIIRSGTALMGTSQILIRQQKRFTRPTNSCGASKEPSALPNRNWIFDRFFTLPEKKSTYLCLLHHTQGVQGVGTPTCDGQHPDERRQSPLLCEDDYFYQSQEKTGKVITSVMLLKPRQKALAPLFNDSF